MQESTPLRSESLGKPRSDSQDRGRQPREAHSQSECRIASSVSTEGVKYKPKKKGNNQMNEDECTMSRCEANEKFGEILFALGLRLTRTEQKLEDGGAYYLAALGCMQDEYAPEFLEQPYTDMDSLLRALEDRIDALCCPPLACWLMPGADLSGMKNAQRWLALLACADGMSDESMTEEAFRDDADFRNFWWSRIHLDVVARHSSELILQAVLEAQEACEREFAGEHFDELD